MQRTLITALAILLLLGIFIYLPQGPVSHAADTDVRGFPFDFSPLNEDVWWVRDEFFSGATGGSINGSMGGLGWGKLAIGAACGNADANSPAPTAWPNSGAYRLRVNSGTADSGCVIYPVGIANGMFRLDNVADWEFKWIFKMESTTDVRFRIGACGDNNLATNMVDNFIGLRFDTDPAFDDDVDGAGNRFWVVTRATDVITGSETESAIAVDTNWHQIRVRSRFAGTIVFNVDEGADIEHSANIPTDDMAPCVHYLTDSTAAKDFGIDFFAMQRKNISR